MSMYFKINKKKSPLILKNRFFFYFDSIVNGNRKYVEYASIHKSKNNFE